MELKITEPDLLQKKVVGTQVSLDLYNKLKDDADNNFMSISDLLRKLIVMYFRDKEEMINK